jgi:hypothetical protein
MLQRLSQHPGGLPPAVIQASQLGQVHDFPRGRIQPVLMLQLPREFFGEQRARVADKLLQAIARRLIESHERLVP